MSKLKGNVLIMQYWVVEFQAAGVGWKYPQASMPAGNTPVMRKAACGEEMKDAMARGLKPKLTKPYTKPYTKP